MYLLLPFDPGRNRQAPGHYSKIHFVLEDYSLCRSTAAAKGKGMSTHSQPALCPCFLTKKNMKLAQKIAIPEDRNSQPRWSFPFFFDVPKKTLACRQCLAGKNFSAK